MIQVDFSKLSPQMVWQHFETLCTIPRPSKHEQQLRQHLKDWDRIQVMADGLKTMGIDCTPTDDGIIIEGKGKSGDWSAIFTGGEIESHHDHRIAMSFSMAGLRTSGNITIHGTETVATSFPTFTELANTAGLDLQVVNP